MARKYTFHTNYAVIWYDQEEKRYFYVSGMTAKDARRFYERQRYAYNVTWIARVQMKNCNHDVPPITDYQKFILGIER